MKKTKREVDTPHIVTAWAESCSGPGWANSPLYYLTQSASGALRVECLQPDEQSERVTTLYRISNAVSAEMLEAVRIQIEGKP